MSEHMTNYNNIWNGKVEYIQNHTNLLSYQLSNRHEWSIYLSPSPIPQLILIIHFMIYSISNTFLSQRIGRQHYFSISSFPINPICIYHSILHIFNLIYQLLTRSSTIDSTLTKQESLVWSIQYTHNNGISSDSWFKNDHFLSKGKFVGMIRIC